MERRNKTMALFDEEVTTETRKEIKRITSSKVIPNKRQNYVKNKGKFIQLDKLAQAKT